MVIGRFLAIAVVFLSFVWQSGTSFAKYSGGSGTSEDPYKISSAVDLFTLAADTGDYGKNFVLTADIDLSPKRPAGRTFSTAVIVPDADNSDFSFDGIAFTGVFDGAGHKIKNLTINTNGAGNDYLGLFGSVYGDIKNLRLEKISITTGNSSYWLGALAGENYGIISNCSAAGAIKGGSDLGPAGGLVGDNYGTVTNCSSKVIISGDVNSAHIGGIVGYNYQGIVSNSVSLGILRGGNGSYNAGGRVGYNCDGNIINCRSAAKVIAGDQTDSIGGLVGDNTGRIAGSFSAGTLTAGNDSSHLGGLAGVNYTGDIRNSRSAVKVTTGDNSQNLGGLVGDSDSNIVHCYSTGLIKSGSESAALGGLVGNNQGPVSNCYSAVALKSGIGSTQIGGLIGYNEYDSIVDCCSTGAVAAGDDSGAIGGLVGENSGGISNCFSTSLVKGANSSYYVGGLVGNNIDGAVSGCYSAGAVSGLNDSSQIGGLIGGNDTGSVTNCYSTAKVKGGNNSGSIGGLVGDNTGRIFASFSMGAVTGGNSSYYVGGFAGYCGDGNISSCYSTAMVKSGSDSDTVGAFVGDNENTLNNCYSVGTVKGGTNSNNVDGFAGWNAAYINNCYFLATSGPDNGNGQSLTDKQIKQQNSFLGWDFIGETANGQQDTWTSCDGIDYPKHAWYSLDKSPLNVAKCTVAAGVSAGYDSISASGLMHAKSCNFVGAGIIRVTIDSDGIKPHAFRFTVNAATWKNGKFKSSITGRNGITESLFTFDSRSLKFTFAAKNADLSGLYSPLNIRVDIGNYGSQAQLDETIINGASNPIPINLAMGVKNSLRVDSVQVKQDNPYNQLIINGGFSVENPNVDMSNSDFFITLGPRTFMIPAYNFKLSQGAYSCSNVKLFDGGDIFAVFDFNKGAFTLTLTHPSVQNYAGLVNFAINFADFSEAADIVVVP